MKKAYVALATALVALALPFWGGVGNAQQTAAEKAGQKLDEAGRAIKKGFQTAGEKVREGFDKTREGVHNMGVESRVYGRLHWDKALTNSSFELQVSSGVVTLRGAVPDAAAKAKAVTLTADTVGVTQVVDELTVQLAPRTVPATTPGTALPKS
jgi:hyperosmotically inducible protein